MAGEIVITPAGTNAAEFGMRVDQRFINCAGVVIEPARDGEIEARAPFGNAERFERGDYLCQLSKPFMKKPIPFGYFRKRL